MSRRNRRQSKLTSSPNAALLRQLVENEVERRMSQLSLPPGAQPRAINQDALMQQMTAQQAPAKQGTPMFAPGTPLRPQPGVSPFGPRQFSFPVGYNVYSQPRSTESTSFDTLRNLAMLYDGIQLCEQVWLDTVAKLSLKIKPRDEIIAEQGKSASETKYADRIRLYSDFFAMPDQGNGYDLKSWLRAAVRDQLQIDAVGIYIRRNKAGGVYSLELVDGSTIKPLIDPRGRRPLPPFPSYEQFVYGVPAGLYTSEELLYQRETTRTESVYGLSRIERIILRVNQALRKENKDLARFTDGNLPPGVLQPPNDGSEWTPEQLMAYQDLWDALLAGNDQARSRVKVVQPGSTFSPITEPDIFVDFDRFLLNVTAACYSMTMADLGFTENVNKSSGESQENVFYRRAVQPLMDRYATLFTWILRHYFNEQDLIVTWSGFEESEDFNAMAGSYVSLVSSGIISPTTAAHQLNLPWSGPEIPNYVLTKDGITFLEDAADPATRKALNDAKVAGAQLAAQPQQPPTTENEPDNGVKTTEQDEAKASQSDKGQQKNTPPSKNSTTVGGNNQVKRGATADPFPAPAWRPPTQTQLDLEAKLSKAVKAFLSKAQITKDGVTPPDDEDRAQLLDALTQALEAALAEGRRIVTGTDAQRGLISAAKDLAGRALQVVGDIVQSLVEKVQGLLSGIFGDGNEDVDPEEAIVEVQEQVEEWAEDYADMVATTEVCSAVEGAILDDMTAQGATKMYWNAEPGACERCMDNAEASPIGMGEDFPEADTVPPAHPNCRCTVSYDVPFASAQKAP